MKHSLFTLVLLFVVTSAYSQNVPDYVPKCGLIAWYPFTGNAVDSTMHGNDGTVMGATLTADRHGHPNSAYYFNGTTSLIYIPPSTAPNSLWLSGSVSISAWVKTANYHYGSYEQIFWRGDNATAHDQYMLYIDVSNMALRRDVGTGFTTSELDYTTTGIDSSFHHFVATYDSVSGFMSMYLDGVLVTSAYLPGTESYPTSTFFNTIGAVNYPGTWQYFQGAIDDIGVWKRALRACEVQDLYYSAIICGDDTLHGTTDTAACASALPVTLYGPGGYDSYLWSTTDTSRATIVSSAGTYWVNAYSDNCVVYLDTINLTLTPLPVVTLITGPSVLCEGGIIALSDATTGGVWSSVSTSVAGISSLGVVTGAAGGTTTISYSVTNACGTVAATKIITVTLVPAIAGNVPICVGGTITLTDPIGGGTWEPSATPIATVGISSGTVGGVATGTAVVTYTTAAGCRTTAVVTVDPMPLVGSIGGPTSVCAGSAITLTIATAGGAWSAAPSGIATVSAGGVVSGIIPGTATISYAVTNGCGTAAATYVVSVVHGDSTFHVRDTTVCANIGALMLTGPGGYSSYVWSTGSTLPFIGVGMTGTYTRYAALGCSTRVDDFHITFEAVPDASLGNDTAFCAGDSLMLHPPISDGISLVWSNGDVTPSVTAATTGIYWVRITDGICTAIDSISVTVNPIPPVHLGPDQFLCIGATATLHSSDTYTAPSYLWNTGSTAAGISVAVTDTYRLAVTVAGCTGRDTVNVKFNPIPAVDLGNDTSICAGKQLTLSSPASVGSYLWSNGSAAPSVAVADDGTYMLTVTNNGCSYTDSVKVTVIAAPLVSVGADTTLCEGATITVTAIALNGSLVWNTGATTPDIQITAAGIYRATATNQCGSKSDSLIVSYELCDLWLPSAFTPNDDGLNDKLRAVGHLKAVRDFSMAIYNRWGQRVFYTENISEGWDGTFHGVKQDAGTYYYMVHYSISAKERLMKGDITLIR